MKKTNKNTGLGMALGMCLGMSIGSALGPTLFNNIGTGICDAGGKVGYDEN